MLNRSKLFKKVEDISDKIFFDLSNELNIALKAWQIIVNDDNFQQKLQEINSPWLLPKWSENLETKYKSDLDLNSYEIIGIDGSQVYPDRHQGSSAFLINVGAVKLSYSENSKVELFSEPHVFVADDLEDLSINDYVDCLREEFEFNLGLELSQKNRLLIFDGSLIFWHLMSKDNNLKNYFLPKYLDIFKKLHENKILYCSYISLPKNKELINLIRMQLSDFNPDQYLTKVVDKISDADLMSLLLEKNERTIVFENQAQILKFYPDELKPHYFYLNVGDEIARVEVPAWIALDKAKIDYIQTIILDQSEKGGGYPVVLSEAHEQAVIKSLDRFYFYELLSKLGFNRKFNINISKKAFKKRQMTF